jgi:phosphoglycerate dehydrogenase-like enzyme
VAALTLILALATRLLDKHRITLGARHSGSSAPTTGVVELRGKLLGLVGCGAIGRELIAYRPPLGLFLRDSRSRVGCFGYSGAR